jgi:hypothetical protein
MLIKIYHAAVPDTIEYTMTGKTVDDESFEIKVKADCKHLMTRADVLGQMPFLVRKVLQAFIAKPFVYMWFDTVHVSVRIGETTTELDDAKAYHEVSFINSD